MFLEDSHMATTILNNVQFYLITMKVLTIVDSKVKLSQTPILSFLLSQFSHIFLPQFHSSLLFSYLSVSLLLFSSPCQKFPRLSFLTPPIPSYFHNPINPVTSLYLPLLPVPTPLITPVLHSHHYTLIPNTQYNSILQSINNFQYPTREGESGGYFLLAMHFIEI